MFTPVGSANFRTHEIPFDMILKTVRLMASKLPPSEGKALLEEWDKLRDQLENIERRQEFLPKLDIRNLPVQGVIELPALADHLLEPLESPVIRGNVCDEVYEEGRVDEIIVGNNGVDFLCSSPNFQMNNS